MKIGVFGGCFNPPHIMHKNIALNLIEKGYIDKVIFVPTGNFYPKNSLIDYKHREKLLQLLFKGEDGVIISDVGSTKEGQYTYQVLDKLQTIYESAELYFICGEDNLNELDTWKNYEYILTKYKLLVINRNNLDSKKILSKYACWQDKIIWANIKTSPISSTAVRNMLKNKNETEITTYLDQKVYNYIKRNKLYEMM